MASLGTTTTWSPNSFQLRLALNSRKSPAVFLRMRVGKQDRQARVVSSVSANGGGNSWTSSNSSADAFAGWTGADERVDPDRKRWFGGKKKKTKMEKRVSFTTTGSHHFFFITVVFGMLCISIIGWFYCHQIV